MKRYIHQSGAGLLVLLLLAVSTGTTLFTHVCFMSGEKKVSTEVISSCCAAENTTHAAQFTSNCCNDAHAFLKFNFNAVDHRQVRPEQIQPVTAILPIEMVFNTPVISVAIYRDLPPPEIGRDLLIQHSVFRI